MLKFLLPALAASRVRDGFSLLSQQNLEMPIIDRLGADPVCPPQYQPLPLPASHPLIEAAIEKVKVLFQETLVGKSPTAFSAALTYLGEEKWSMSVGKDRHGSAVTADSLFRIGSVSKVFPAITAFQLNEEGSIHSLDDEVKKYAPLFDVINPFAKEGRGITWRQLASQMAGLPREAPCVPISCNYTNDQMLRLLHNVTMLAPQWSRPSYSNLGFSLLGRLQQEIKKIPFEEITASYITTPLKMKNTGFEFTNAVKDRLVPGYYASGEEVFIYNLGWSSPAGQMYSSARDLQTLAHALIGVTEFPGLSHVTRRQLLVQQFELTDGVHGFGTPWETCRVGAYTVRTKGGNVDGYTAVISMVPELGLALVGAWNGGVDEFVLSKKVYEELIPAFTKTLAPIQPMPALPPNLNDYVGNYTYLGVLNATVSIITDPDTKAHILRLDTPGLLGNLPLNYKGSPTSFVIWFPPGALDCLTNSLLGFEGSEVRFGLDKAGRAITVEVPGTAPKTIYHRV